MASKRPISDQLRRAIDASGISRYALCKKIKLQQSAMSRFMAGEIGLSLEVIDRIGAELDLRLTTGKSKGRTKGEG